jgi:hypothetical protein
MRPMQFLLDADDDVRSEHGAWYRVHTSRDVRRRNPNARRRQRLTVERLDPQALVLDDDGRVHCFVRNPRRL